MVSIEITVLLGLIGAAMGSFADALAWRLHSKRNFVSDRSECEHCHHKLGVLDLIPVASWIMLRGKCRYCKAQIGKLVVVVEVLMAAAFVASYLFWPLGFTAWQAAVLFGLWLCYLVAFGVLVIYDARWMMLPDKIVFPLIAAAFVDAGLRISLQAGADATAYVIHAILGILALAGVYGAIYIASRGRLVGFGDVKLGVFMGVILGWQKALLVLMLANIIGFLFVLPGLLTGKLDRRSRVPFGPFLILAFIIAGLFGNVIITWYLSLVGVG